MNAQERALLAMDVAWVQWRSEFRQKLFADGVLERPVRSIFEADMIFSIVAHHALLGRPVTLKELATYFGMIATEATVSLRRCRSARTALISLLPIQSNLRCGRNACKAARVIGLCVASHEQRCLLVYARL